MPQKPWVFGIVVALLLWFAPLGSYTLFNPDEGRYAEIPREMVASGDWVTPRLNGLKYFEKPPLHYWATAVAFSVFGEHEWSARAWVALCGFFGLLLTAWVGTRVFGARVGALAALVQGGSLLYLALARMSTLDMGLSIALEVALVGLLLLVSEQGASRERSGALLLAVGTALAFLSKGLVGILIPGVVATLYLLLRRDWRLLLRARPWWVLIALALIAAPWVVLVSQRNPEFARFFFIHEHFQRFLTRVHARYEPDWFFIPVLLLGFLPWTELLPAVVARSYRAMRAGDGATWMLALWVLFGFLFFSISQSKLIPYILPLFPALALLTGRALADLPAPRLMRALAVAAALWLLLGVLVVTVWLNPAWAARLEIGSGAALPLMAGAFMAAGLACAYAARLALRRGTLAATVAAAVGTLLLLGLLPLAADQLPRQRELARLIAAVRPELKAATPFYCVDDYEQSIPFYLDRTCTLVRYRGELDFGLNQQPARWLADLPQFAERWQAQSNAVAVIRASAFPTLQQMGLPMRVIYTAPSMVAVARQ
jgi:4-amino-4-deoxy-L-arabinose transferase-like glycosyltransferase